MALRLITEGEFRSSRYGNVADQIEGRLSVLIEQAESYIESRLDRVLSETEYEEVPEIGRVTLFLRQSPITEVLEVKVGNTVLLPSEYSIIADEGLIKLYTAPGGQDVRVRYKAGFIPIPPVIKSAVILQTAYLCYQDFEIYGSGDSKPPGIRYLQEDINEMIRPFKRKPLL